MNDLISECAWFKVYDTAEALHADRASRPSIWAESFEDKLNDSFLEEGIGWKMTDGEITYRGSDTFTEATQQACQRLEDTGAHPTAANQVREALRDISCRPGRDVTGAIQHVMSTLEYTAREMTGQRNLTLDRLPPPRKEEVSHIHFGPRQSSGAVCAAGLL